METITAELLNFLIILSAACGGAPAERERMAFRLMVVSCAIMALLFLIGTILLSFRG